MNIVIGIIGLAACVYLYKQITSWWIQRKQRLATWRTLRPGAGLDHPYHGP